MNKILAPCVHDWPKHIYRVYVRHDTRAEIGALNGEVGDCLAFCTGCGAPFLLPDIYVGNINFADEVEVVDCHQHELTPLAGHLQEFINREREDESKT